MAGWGIIGFATGAVAVGVVWLGSRRAAAAMPDSPLGDVPFIPEGFGGLAAPDRNRRGGKAEQPSAADTRHVRTHDRAVDNS